VAAPGATVTRLDTPPPRSEDTDTGKLFLACLTDRGPIDRASRSRRSPSSSTCTAAARPTRPPTTSRPLLPRGRRPAIIARYAGPSAAKAKRNLLDGASGVALAVAALGVGSYANSVDGRGHPPGRLHVHGHRRRHRGRRHGVHRDLARVRHHGRRRGADDFDARHITQGASTNDPAVLAASVLGSPRHRHRRPRERDRHAAHDGAQPVHVRPRPRPGVGGRRDGDRDARDRRWRTPRRRPRGAARRHRHRHRSDAHRAGRRPTGP
jgi:hypothetical protein